MCVSPPCSYVHLTLAPPSAAHRSSLLPSKSPHTHMYQRSPRILACGQTARWHHTKWPTVDTHTSWHKWPTPCGPPTESPSQSFCFFLWIDVHVGLINAQNGSLSVLPSVSLYAIWPTSLSWIENIGAHPHDYQQCMCVCVVEDNSKKELLRGVSDGRRLCWCVEGGMERWRRRMKEGIEGNRRRERLLCSLLFSFCSPR